MIGPSEHSDPSATLIQRLDIDFALQAAGLGVWELDPATRVVNWDDRCRELFGLAKANQIPYSQAIAYIHPDDITRVNEAVQRAITPPTDGQYDQTYRTLGADDGLLRWVRFVGRSYFSEAGELIRFAGVASDVTKEVLATQQKQTEQERFQTMVEQAPVAMALFSGPRFVITLANERVLEYWDRTREQVMNKPLFEALPEASGQGYEELLMQVYTTGEPYVANELTVNLTRNGRLERTYINFVYEPFRESDGTISGITVACAEVTDQVRVRQKVEESRLELAFAIDAAEMGVWDLNVKTSQFRSNTRMRDWFGLPPEGDVDIAVSLDRIVTTDRQRVIDALQQAMQYESGGHCDITYTITHPTTGQKRIIRAKGQALFNPDQTVSRFNGIVQDITTHQQAEEALRASELRFRTLADSIDQLAWIANASGWIYWYNQRWYDYTGTDLEQMAGWGWQSAHHPDHVQRVTAFVEKAWLGGDPFELTFPLRGRDGRFRWFLTRVYPVRDAAGQVIQWVGTNTNIDEQKQLEANLEAQVRDRTEQLQVLVQDLQRSNDNLQQFAYIASHDLQEPLRKIQQFGDLLKDHYAGQLADGAHYLTRMQTAAGRMSVFIKDLLDYSRIATQQDTTTRVSLQQVVAQAVADLDLRLEETGGQVQIDSLPIIAGNASQLGQLFYNLLSNALKFRREGVRPIVVVHCAVLTADALPPAVRPARVAASYYHISVADNGIGFEEKYLDRIFQVFQRLHGKNEYAGTGIGLAICEKVVINHGGAITASSQPGQGATFSVFFPS